ncbi:NACHT domain-containing protein [Priestia megaterium]|uniref:NACHT domain-containing protein n=1 Tax=Priestia megaterium TaxID=1404 RepID=UPI00221FFE4E|nr:hypothetical protein [Priestia megaterium]UYV55658.1 hypothetical protein OHU65_26720 [Priestia megaterium]
MGDYNLNRLNTRDFEHLVQALSRKIMGDAVITFGDGTDGGREATYHGRCNFPNEAEQWQGYWVIQAKFKQRESEISDFDWIKNNFVKEMEKFRELKLKGVEIPENYLFFTNAILTPVLERGGRDKIDILVKEYQKELIPNIHIFSYDDLCRMLDDNRDIATTYSSFILPGDVLYEVFNFFENQNKKDHSDLLFRFLEREFNDNLFSRLEQGGKLTDEKVKLEKLFVDLRVTNEELTSVNNKEDKFIKLCLKTGNNKMNLNKKDNDSGFVFIGGAGFGKSTLTQFLSQIYRAYFLKHNDADNLSEKIIGFLEDYSYLEVESPNCLRFPFTIVLKDYAEWMKDNKKAQKSFSILSYLQHKIEQKGEGEISIEDLREILSKLSWLFIFDGLDEVPVSSNRSDLIEQIEDFLEVELRRKNVDALVIATTRPQGYTKEFDQSKFKHLYIKNLTEDECISYLDRLLKNTESSAEKRDEFMKILKKALQNDMASKLMETPLQATIMSVLVMSGGEPPRMRYGLFTDFYDVMLKRERQKGVVNIIRENPEYIEEIHNKLGFELQRISDGKDNPSSSIDESEFELFIREYLINDIEIEEEKVNKYTAEILEAIKDRLVFITNVEQDKIGFSIRSLQEYFAANYLMHNQRDADIPKKLKLVSGKIYWRNTFLFALGYLNRYKGYLIELIESICSDLDGASENLDETTFKSVSKVGSWLALDILNEGVFRNKPRFENKFARYIENLFKLAPSEFHLDIGRLPVNIIEKWVIQYIKESLDSNNKVERFTGIYVSLILLKSGFYEIESLIDNYSFKTSEEEKFFVERGCHLRLGSDTLFAEKCINILDSSPLFSYYSNFDISSNGFNRSDILMEMINSKNFTGDVQQKVIQNIFFHNLVEGSYSNVLLNALSNINLPIDQEHDDQSIKGNTINVDLVPEYSCFISSIKPKISSQNLENLIEAFSEKELHYIVKYLKFIQKPSILTLKHFLIALRDEDENIFNMFQDNISTINWLLTKLFSIFPTHAKLPEAICYVEEGYLGEINDWENFEKDLNENRLTIVERFDIVYLHEGRTIPFGSDIYQDFYSNYLQAKGKVKNEQELKWELILTSWMMGKFVETVLPKNVFYEKILQELKLALSTFTLTYRPLEQEAVNSAWINLISCTSNKDMMQLINDNPTNIHFAPSLEITRSNMKKSDLSNFYQCLMLMEKETNLIKLIPSTLLNSKENIEILQRHGFDFFLETKFSNDENETIRVILNTLNPEIGTVVSYEKIFKDLTNNIIKFPIIFKMILILFKDKLNNLTHRERLLKDLYMLIDKENSDNITLLSRYEELFKEDFESSSIEWN